MRKKRFNVTGLCVPDKHYMVDISGKLAQIRELIDDEHYFTINRARQYGKTTTLLALERALDGEYVVASISFEGLGDESFESPEVFCITFMEIVQKALTFTSAEKEYIDSWLNKDANNFTLLSSHITEMCKDKRLVLLIDEVDKTSNNRVFLNFLSMLRTKYLARNGGKDYTFHSVILAGVYDIKAIKLKIMREEAGSMVREEVKTYNSPWNIAVDFDVDMSFSAPEIATMLADYENDHHTGMDITAVSEEIRRFTSGYPFLVSRVCQYIDEKMGAGNWTVSGVRTAVKKITFLKNLLFDDIFKNMENDRKVYDFMYNLLIVGNIRRVSKYDPVVELCSMYGFITIDSGGTAHISNMIFENVMVDYFISIKHRTTEDSKQVRNSMYEEISGGETFDMELCLRKFAEHYAEIYTERDIAFYERHGRLMFLSYLKPLVNGHGNFYIESQFTDERRMDVVVDFRGQQFIIELKLWRGEKAQENAYRQLLGYMNSKDLNEGYLLTFDLRKGENRESKTEWVETQNGDATKRIFEVVV